MTSRRAISEAERLSLHREAQRRYREQPGVREREAAAAAARRAHPIYGDQLRARQRAAAKTERARGLDALRKLARRTAAHLTSATPASAGIMKGGNMDQTVVVVPDHAATTTLYDGRTFVTDLGGEPLVETGEERARRLQRAAQAKYCRTEKGRAVVARYRASAKGRAVRAAQKKRRRKREAAARRASRTAA